MKTHLFLLFSSIVSISYSQTLTARQFIELTTNAQHKLDSSQWNEAIVLWNKVVKQNPVRADYWMNLATAQYQNKNYKEAIPSYTTAMELKFEIPSERAMDIARCYAQLHQKDSCFRWMEKAINVGYPEFEELKTDSAFLPFYSDGRFQKLLWLKDTKKMSRNEGWEYDLDFLYWQIRRVHFDPYRKFSKEDFDKEVNAIRKSIPASSDLQITAELIKLVAMVADGHSELYAKFENSRMLDNLPVVFRIFKEGMFIIATDSSQSELLGTCVNTFDGQSIDEVMTKLNPYLSYESEMWASYMGQYTLRNIPLLNAIGITKHDKQVTLSLTDMNGKEKKVVMNTIHQDSSDVVTWNFINEWKNIYNKTSIQPLYRQHGDKYYWFEYLPEQKAVYFKFNVVYDDSEKLGDFSKRMFAFIDSHEVEKLVIDIRDNGGGNTWLLQPLLNAIMTNAKTNQQGKLFCIIGRHTFSACQNFTTYLERFTNVTFVGEPTGSSPNFIGEIHKFKLPYSHYTANISNLYWGTSYAEDTRTWTAPQIYVPPSFEDVLEGKDGALEAILSY